MTQPQAQTAGTGAEGAPPEGGSGGEKPSGYVDTGVELITADPVDGVESKDAAFGEENCWG